VATATHVIAGHRSWLFLLASIAPALLCGQGTCPTKHLAVFDADIAEFTEERTLDLHSGSNSLEWRSLVPQTFVGTLRVNPEQAEVIRQSITFDGPEVRGQRSPVLRLELRNSGASGPRKVRVDYLAPKLGWKADYSLVLGPASQGTPKEMLLDGWVSVRNESGTDVCADVVDLIAGDVQLVDGGGATARDYAMNAQMANAYAGAPEAPLPIGAQISQVSVFSRITLGNNLLLPANAYLERFPLVQRVKLELEQRNVFENDATAQTLGRGGFTLLPRGLEVRLVSRNTTNSPLPAGTVTIYSPEGEGAQVVGQDRIPLTPPGADLSITQGRSNNLQGTRRVVERVQVPEPENHYKLVTRVDVVIENRGAQAETAFVREGVEHFGKGDWTVTQSSHTSRKLGDRSMEFKVAVAAKAQTRVTYTVESR
jgi:hypothetical protein